MSSGIASDYNLKLHHRYNHELSLVIPVRRPDESDLQDTT